MSLDRISLILKVKFPAVIVDELLESYSEQKRNFFLGNYRPNEIEGGRFSEAAFRLLEDYVGFSVTPLGSQVNTDTLIKNLQNLPGSSFNDSVRLHIPRTLRVVYDIRNKRDVAHLSDGIDPNIQDSTFVFSCLDWVLAELIRLSNGTNPQEAYALISEITIQKIPVIQDFNGYLKTLNPDLGVSDRLLLLLYHRGTEGAAVAELSEWVKPSQRTNLKRTLNNLDQEKDLIVLANGKYKITRRGILEVQNKNLLEI